MSPFSPIRLLSKYVVGLFISDHFLQWDDVSQSHASQSRRASLCTVRYKYPHKCWYFRRAVLTFLHTTLPSRCPHCVTLLTVGSPSLGHQVRSHCRHDKRLLHEFVVVPWPWVSADTFQTFRISRVHRYLRCLHLGFVIPVAWGQWHWHDLPIISQWEEMEIPPFQKIWTRSGCLFQDYVIMNHFWWPTFKFRSVTPYKVTWGHWMSQTLICQ